MRGGEADLIRGCPARAVEQHLQGDRLPVDAGARQSWPWPRPGRRNTLPASILLISFMQAPLPTGPMWSRVGVPMTSKEGAVPSQGGRLAANEKNAACRLLASGLRRRDRCVEKLGPAPPRRRRAQGPLDRNGAGLDEEGAAPRRKARRPGPARAARAAGVFRQHADDDIRPPGGFRRGGGHERAVRRRAPPPLARLRFHAGQGITGAGGGGAPCRAPNGRRCRGRRRAASARGCL